MFLEQGTFVANGSEKQLKTSILYQFSYLNKGFY